MLARATLARTTLVAAVVLVALALSACGSPSPSARGAGSSTTGASHRTTTTQGGNAPTGRGTQEVGFDPYTAQGTVRATLQVTQTVSGTCVSPGVAGATSYRCFAQPSSSIYDPCFAPAHATTGPLTCVAAPTDIDAVAFDVGALPTAPAGVPATRPWAMRLVNGQVCVLVNAAWGGLGPFACPTPAAADSVADCHVPQQATPWWSAACQAQQSASSPFTALDVDTVWTGPGGGAPTSPTRAGASARRSRRR